MLYKTEFGNYKVRAIRSTYANNNRLAIRLMDMEDDTPVCVMTVNLVNELAGYDEHLAFVDTNNNPDIEKFIAENELGEPVGYYGVSGYCSYPLYKFNLEKLEEA